MKLTVRNIFLLICCITYGMHSYAQDSLSKSERRKLKKLEKEREGRFMITPLAGPAYTPELSFTIAGGILMSWRNSRTDTTLQRSVVPMNIGVSTSGAFFVNSKSSTFWNHDKVRVYTDINFKNMPDNFFGIGYEKGNTVPKSDTTTAYHRLWWQLNPRMLWQFRKNFFIGGTVDINYTKGSDPCPAISYDHYYLKYNDRPFNVGIGGIFQYDTRDIAVNPWKGEFVELQGAVYGTYLGGQNNYEMLSVDAREYWQLFKPGQTLALQVKGHFTTGDVPYGEMSQLGTPFDLRGYLWGQYRDYCMLFSIAEYRHTFYTSAGVPGKFGGVIWTGVGSISPRFLFYQGLLPNVGVGFRYEVQPRMNLRLDYGIGKNTSGFYFNFNEAF